MMLGGLSMGCAHLYRIIQSIQPKKVSMKIIIGTHSKAKSTMFFSKKALLQRRKTPRIICATPKSTESFIFREFTYSSSLLAPAHAQSRPNGYGPLSTSEPSFLTLNVSLGVHSPTSGQL